MRATRRRWNPNVQKINMVLKGKTTRAYVCTKCIKANKVVKAIHSKAV
jgi:large subunit ribosomal protein L28